MMPEKLSLLRAILVLHNKEPPTPLPTKVDVPIQLIISTPVRPDYFLLKVPIPIKHILKSYRIVWLLKI